MSEHKGSYASKAHKDSERLKNAFYTHVIAETVKAPTPKYATITAKYEDVAASLEGQGIK